MKVDKNLTVIDQIYAWLDEQRLDLQNFVKTLGAPREGYRWVVEIVEFEEGIGDDCKVKFEAKEELI